MPSFNPSQWEDPAAAAAPNEPAVSFDEGSLVPAAAGAPHAPAGGVAALTPQPPPTLMGGEQAVGLRYVRSKRDGKLHQKVGGLKQRAV